MQLHISGDRLAAFIESAITSAPHVADYLNKLNPNRPQTGCVIRLTYRPVEISPLQDILILPVGSLSSQEIDWHTRYTYEKIQRMFCRNSSSSWITRNPAQGYYGGAIRILGNDIGLAVSGWWEEYDVLHAVWLGLRNRLITDEQACVFIRELDSAYFGDGMTAYRHLAPRLESSSPPPNWVIRYFAEQGGAIPNVWRG